MSWKRNMTMTLAVVLAISTAACSQQVETEVPKGNENSKEPIQSSESEPVNAKITITAMDYRYGDPPPSKSPGLDMINERFNIDFKMNYVTNTAYDEKITAIFSSGDIPDMVGFMSADLKNRYRKFAKQNAFLQLDDHINEYPSLKLVPDYIWDSVRVGGKIYAIPHYAPKYQVLTVLRKDWLDALKLKVPTNYDELKEVALAFTKNDPDGNSKNDTYGIAIGMDINPNFNQGPYWDPDAWYHQNDSGEFIPGMIGPGRKEIVQMLADLYQEGAITKDFATMNWADTNKEFYSGKAGIFIGTPRGMSQAYMDGLLEIDPKAEFIALPPFKDAYGNEGLTAGPGLSGLTVLNAKLSKDPDKIKRILELNDFGRTFYPDDQKNENNADFDWWSGKVGVGYDMVDGLPVNRPNFASDGLAPSTYFLDNTGWAPNDNDVNYSITYQTKPLVDLVADIENMYKGIKLYANPINGIDSQADVDKGAELKKFLMNEQVKMIAGNRPVSDWDAMVSEYLKNGGEQIIKEYNDEIKNKDVKELFK